LSTVKKKWANASQTEATKTTSKVILVEISFTLGTLFSLETKRATKANRLITVKKILKELICGNNHQVANNRLKNSK